MSTNWNKADPKHLTVLLLEDDDGEAKAVVRAFRHSRILNDIVRVKDGLEGLDMLRKKLAEGNSDPVVALVDINMPRMNGHEFVETIRADKDLHELTVFMLTTSEDRDDIERAYDSHVAGYIVKERAGEDFLLLVNTLESYWRVVEFPPIGQAAH